MDKLATYIVREGALSTYDAVGWVVRLASTLEPLHGLGVSHGRVSAKAIHIEDADCRSQGFLLDAGDVADDPAYFSKDRCKGGVRSPVNDTWAVGVVLYQCLTGSLPFPGTTRRAVLDNLEGAPPAPLAVFDAGDDALQILLDRVFAPATVDRLDALRELREALVARAPSYADLPPLSYGRPEEVLANQDEEDDSTTSVIPRAEIFSALARVRERDEARAAKAAPPEAPVPKPVAVKAPPPRPEPPRPAPPKLEPRVPMPAPRVPVPEPPKPAPPKPEPPKPAPPVPVPPVPEPPKPEPPKPEAEAPPPDRLASTQVMQDEPVDALAKTMPLRDAPLELRARADEILEDETRDLYRMPAADLSDIDDEDSDDDWDVPQRDSAELIAASIVDSLSATPAPVLATSKSSEPIGAPPAKLPPVVKANDDVGEAARKRGGGFGTVLVALLFVVVGGGAAYALFGWPPKGLPNVLGGKPKATPPPPPAPATTGPPPSSAAPSSDTSAAASAAAMANAGGAGGTGDAGGTAGAKSEGGAAPAAASGSALAPAAGPAATLACVAPLFPEGSFSSGRVRFDFMCDETNPYRGASQLHTQVVLGGGRGVTDAMREWSTLGWYNMAAFAVVRTRCCSSPPPLRTKTTLTRCKFDERLEAVSKAAMAGSEADAKLAVTEYTEAVHCLARGGTAHLFGQVGYPQGGEITSFNKTMARARALLSK